MKIDKALLVRYRENDLDPADAERIRQELDRNPELRSQMDHLVEMQGLLKSHRPDSFGPNFADRVVRKLNAIPRSSAPDSMYDSLVWLFPRLSIASLALVVAMGAYNVFDPGVAHLSASFWDALLGLPSTSLSSLFWLS